MLPINLCLILIHLYSSTYSAMDQHVLETISWVVLPGHVLPNLAINLVGTLLK